MLSEAFKQELVDAYRLLGEAQRKLASLKGQADLDGLPPEVSRRLENKHKAIGHAREDLKEIPKLAAQGEVRR